MSSSDQAINMSETGRYRCYAIRRVNPFLGVLQVIRTPDGRALSTNGVVWDIEIKVDQPVGWGSLNQDNTQTIYYRVGLWSKEDGLIKRPLAPHMTTDLAMEQCTSLIEQIQANLHRLPFKLVDDDELWLFDATGEKPLALLDTKIPGEQRQSPEARYWKASLGSSGTPGQARFSEASALEAQVKKCAGFNINKRWLRRQADGSGVLEDESKVITAAHFPAYLVSQDWADSNAVGLVEDYIAWTAPALLTLQRLQSHERTCLEESLMAQAVSIEYHWQLYPEIIDQSAIDAARVKSQFVSVTAQGG